MCCGHFFTSTIGKSKAKNNHPGGEILSDFHMLLHYLSALSDFSTANIYCPERETEERREEAADSRLQRQPNPPAMGSCPLSGPPECW